MHLYEMIHFQEYIEKLRDINFKNDLCLSPHQIAQKWDDIVGL